MRISICLSDSLNNALRQAANKKGVSINQLINTALAEKLSALMREECIVERSKQGSRKKFERAMGKVKDIEPDENDQI